MKKIIVSIIVLCLILSSISIVNASTGTVNLTANKSVKPGETFTVTLSVSCEDGINGVNTTYNYDHNKLELVSANVANSNWASLGTDNSITVISNSSSKVTSSDVYVLTFKVKDNATGTIKVETSDIMIDSDLAENSSFNVKAKSIDINIITNNNPGDDNQGSDKPGDNNSGNNNPGDNNSGDNKPGNNNQGNNNQGGSNQGNNNQGGNNQGSTNGSTNKNDNTTVTDTKLPKTGDVNLVLVTSIGIAVASAIGFFVKAKSISLK